MWLKGFDAHGKRVAVIGAGATGIQILQELSKETSDLGVFMRGTSYCLPIVQKPVDLKGQEFFRAYYPLIFNQARASPSEFATFPQPCGIFDISDEERAELFEHLWQLGGFHYLSRNCNDFLVDPRANKIVYDFWAKKTRARINTPYKRELLAPENPPFHFGTKRCPLETEFYDCMDKENVELISLLESPIQSFTSDGIATSDGKERKFDVIVLATGFDALTRALYRMGLVGRNGVDNKDAWADGIKTYMGLSIPNFPNAFIIYGPHGEFSTHLMTLKYCLNIILTFLPNTAPSTLSNGPTLIESQADLVAEMIKTCENDNLTSVDATVEAAQEWIDAIDATTKQTLLALTKSWWTNSNVAGKKTEFLTYIGGIKAYEEQCGEKIVDWTGFNVVSGPQEHISEFLQQLELMQLLPR
ncbi:hypothetical protein BKA64DRAFT_766752 [Cadophora sp. MPI-SDFR-AT-0126]|nr:hypothetical protein BKA64DRAFT_766752 [Leotiomycetes sp. MPI-SDFR-AT-0126]